MLITIDNIDLYATYGLQVKSTKGELDFLKVKQGNSHNYNDEHGLDIDLSTVYYEPREIIIDFILKAATRTQFAQRCRDFATLIRGAGVHVMKMSDLNRPFFVYCQDIVNLDRKTPYNDASMFGEFSVKFIEKDPVGRMFSTPQTSLLVVSITTTTTKPITIYWGDGLSTAVMAGTGVITTHNYAATRALYYVYVAGDVAGSAIVTKSANLTEITT